MRMDGRLRSVWALSSVAMFAAGCGYVGEPLPPSLNIPEAVADFSAVERGESIILEFTTPKMTTDGVVLSRLGEIDIRAGLASGSTFDIAEWEASSKTIASPPPEKGHIRVRAPVKPWIGAEVILGVRVAGPKRRFSRWSNLVTLHVTEPLSQPTGLSAAPVRSGVKVSWNPNDSRPGLAFRVFRKAPGQESATLAARIESLEWVDSQTEYGKTYEYSVQAIFGSVAPEPESEISGPVAISPQDLFEPAAPQGLTAQPGAGTIELTWERNTEPDFAGYRVYRAIEGGASERIADSVTAPAYSDSQIEPGKRYTYTVTALDAKGHESPHSEGAEIRASVNP